jgi:alcohol dehydrogenase (cytochrome c)
MRKNSLTATTLILTALSARASLAVEPLHTAAQAANGKQQYESHCVECHHMTLRGTGHGPELAGPNFLAKWGNRTIADLLTVTQMTMPAGAPNSLDEMQYLDLVAYMLSANGASAGSQALAAPATMPIGIALRGENWDSSTADAAPAANATESWSSAGTIAEAAKNANSFGNRDVKNYMPVTDDMLRDPDVADWINWRRTQDGQGFSPLAQINRRNVRKLTLAWAITMREGSNQVSPLVHDGVMFLTHPGNVVQAVDAAGGDLIWEYAHAYPPASRTLGGPTKNIAIYQDKVFLATYDAALIALDARTGKLLWKAVKADYRKGYTHTAGPFVADGVVISGINGCERYKKEGCFVTGHDPVTGQELWRTSTIALPGDPNDASWGGVPPTLRAGGDIWMAGSYDPVRKLYYVGTSQAKPWVAASRGMSPLDAALYTNSTLAIEPRTGRIAWYYQHIPGETLDMEVGFERVLVDIGGKPLLFTIGKDGILWKLDRGDGRFVDFAETMFQNQYAPLDRKTGRLRYRQDIIDAKVGETVSVCPSIYGGHNWQSTAYYPPTQSLIIPQQQLCVDMVGRHVVMKEGEGGYGGESTVYPMPGSNGMLARLSSWDLEQMKERWVHQQRAMFLTSVLTTAGGLAFVGDVDRYLKAFDVDTGKVLWQTRLGAALHGFPVSYAVNGKQYVAVPTGMGVFKLLTAKQSPEIYQPNGGNELYVFALGD